MKVKMVSPDRSRPQYGGDKRTVRDRSRSRPRETERRDIRENGRDSNREERNYDSNYRSRRLQNDWNRY